MQSETHAGLLQLLCDPYAKGVTVKSGENNLVLVSNDPDGHVTKLPLPGTSTLLEALMVATLEEAPQQPPLAIPSLIDHAESQWVILTKVPGSTLDREQVRTLSSAELHTLGQRTGRFVAWLASAISLDVYDSITIPTDRMPVNRLERIAPLGQYLFAKGETDETLASILAETGQEYLARHTRGEFMQPPIIGHDDLRTDNLTFTHGPVGWELAGVFDFGSTQPSWPERELRHLLPLGEVATEAAVQAYETETGQRLDYDLMRFWAIGQAGLACAFWLSERDPAQVAYYRNDLKQLLPREDWSGLEGAAALGKHYSWPELKMRYQPSAGAP